jgi:VWFA-related protein
VQDLAGVIVANLGAQDEAIVIRFVDSSKVEVIEEWTGDKTKLLASMKDKLYIEGGQSAVLDAVYLAAENIKAKGQSTPLRRNAIILISDCEDRDSYYKVNDILNVLKGTDIQIFTIALTSEIGSSRDLASGGHRKKAKAEDLSKTLAFATGGNNYILDKKLSEILPASLKSLVVELRSQYVVGFTPTNQNRDTIRKLRVEVSDGAKGEKRQGLIRESYFVPKE